MRINTAINRPTGHFKGAEVNIIYHGTPKSYFESLDPTAPYIPSAFDADGFIHTTEGREALSIILTSFYKAHQEPFVVLHIDKDRITAPVRYDDPARIFPHIYGPLNRDAIVWIEDIERA